MKAMAKWSKAFLTYCNFSRVLFQPFTVLTGAARADASSRHRVGSSLAPAPRQAS